MAYIEHKLVDDKQVIETASYLLEPKLDVLDKFTLFAPERFYGQHGDKVTVRVPGALPAREYGWRNDRSEPIKTDTYEETTVDITVGPPTNDYSAVKLTDEQAEFDLKGGFGLLLDAQTSTVANKVNQRAREEILTAPYEIAIAADVTRTQIENDMKVGQDTWFNAFVDAGRQMNQLGVPIGNRTALVGQAVAAELQKSQKLHKVQGNNSDAAFATANIGVYAGFNIVEDQAGLVEPDEALVFDQSGFQFWSHAPAIPQGAVRGARTNVNGVGMRWIVDYDNGYQVDRSTFNTWTGFNYARDFVKGHDTVGNLAYGTEPYFVRGVKLIFKDGTGGWHPGDGGVETNGRRAADPESELARYYNRQPLKSFETPEGKWYPNILEGNVPVGGDTSGE